MAEGDTVTSVSWLEDVEWTGEPLDVIGPRLLVYVDGPADQLTSEEALAIAERM